MSGILGNNESASLIFVVFKTNRLAKSYSVTTIVLDQERPTVVRKAERNKDYGAVHLDIGADQMGS